MSSLVLSSAWANTAVKGNHKLVLVALADHAGQDGRVQLATRRIAELCGLSKTRVSDILAALIKAGAVQVVATGAGRANATTYRVVALRMARQELQDPPVEPEEPAPIPLRTIRTEPQPSPCKELPVPETNAISQIEVDQILRTAGVTPPEDQPFFWSRLEHRQELSEASERFGGFQALHSALQTAVLGGARLEHQPRRISEILSLAKSKGKGRV